MRSRFKHAAHLVRVAALFIAGFMAFLVARWALVPSDFGTLGFYRAGAIADARAHPIAYAGTATCQDCHVGKYESEDLDAPVPADPVKDNRHSVLHCEACHGPLAFHVADQRQKEADDKAGKETPEGHEKPVPHVGSDKLCLGCHQEITGRPETQPQVVPVEHGQKDECLSCHRPHRPRTDEDEE
jgi:hypothetical protein